MQIFLCLSFSQVPAACLAHLHNQQVPLQLLLPGNCSRNPLFLRCLYQEQCQAALKMLILHQLNKQVQYLFIPDEWRLKLDTYLSLPRRNEWKYIACGRKRKKVASPFLGKSGKNFISGQSKQSKVLLTSACSLGACDCYFISIYV